MTQLGDDLDTVPASSGALPFSWFSKGIDFIRHQIADWPVWWREQSPLSKWLPIALVLPYWILLYFLHGLRIDHWLVCGVLLLLSYTGRDARTIRRFLMPFALTAILYDSQRYYSDYIRGTIRVAEPYQFDKTFFGIHTADGKVLTPNEWCQLHTHPALDLITGFAYLVFFSVFIFISAYFYFYVRKKGTAKMPAAKISRLAPAMGWSFFWTNMLGYSTYYWYPAAPPWYVAQYGLGPANLSAQPNPAGCLRFDQLLGTHFFSEMYGRSADVFGAIPSLHIAYPLLAVYFAFRFGSARVFSICFYLLMCFSAVYLNHHYVLDILWGSVYALVWAGLMDAYYTRKNEVSLSG